MATTSEDVEHLRDRVRLFLQVILSIDVLAYVSDLVTPLYFGRIETPELPFWFQILRWSVTAVLVASWAAAKFARPSRRVLVVLETGMTLALTFVYIQLSSVYLPDEMAAIFALIGIVLLLVVRASLVPSPVLRTALIGIGSVGSLLVLMYPSLRASNLTLDALSFMGMAFIIATSVTSRVIYGLRAQVRDAMRLGQYELGRKLGEGGMGVVYQATHMMLRRPTAVKLLRPDKIGEQTVARFEREVQQTSRLEHPNSVRIYDYGRTPDGQFYYAMEYLDGVTLEELVALEGPIGDARTAAILCQTARALAEAHAIGLVHRDIKPANIMLCDRAQIPDTVKVLDFGLVKVTDDPEADGGITQANTVVGTPHYLSPEAITSPDEVGAPADVYALGAVGFFLLTGRQLFPGTNAIEVCSQHLTAEPDAPSDVLGHTIDRDLESLILRCLKKAPEARPADGARFADAIDRLELRGWTVEEARDWWRAFTKQATAEHEVGPTDRTQLAVAVEGRA